MILHAANWYGEAAVTADFEAPAIRTRTYPTHSYVVLILPFFRCTIGRRSAPSFFPIGTLNGTPEPICELNGYSAEFLIPEYAGTYDAVEDEPWR